MKTRIILIVLALAAMLALSVGLSAAQGPHPTPPTGQAGGEPQALVGSAFTYQGHLKKGGSPVNATCDMVFRLYDDATGGNLHGTITTTVTIESGLFTVVLDFGPYAFYGSARWLEVAVQCPGDTTFNTLTPRQALTATPYALSLRPGAEIIEAVGSSWIFLARNTATSTVSGGLLGMSDSTLGYGVVGHATAGSGETYGVYGQSDSSQGTGVYGYAGANSGENAGVYGRSDSTAGHGVYGWALATSGNTYGVYGRADSPAGHGVHGVGERGVYGVTDSTTGRGVVGYATATSGDARGVAGYSDSTGGIGVFGRAGATAGTTYGVYGWSDSPQGRGVYGYNSSSTDGVGVYGVGPNAVIGISSSPGYAAIYGRNQATTGTGMGVYGQSDSTDGYGVWAWASATTGTTYGVYGRSDSIGGRGVYGEATASGGGTGVMARSYSTQGYGVWAWASATTGTTVGVYGRSSSVNGRGVVGDAPDSGAGSGPGYAGYFYGDVHVAGTLSKSAGAFKIDHPLDPANKYLNHSFVESPDMMNIYNGNVTLDENGAAWVQLPEWFEALNRDFRYQLTPIGAPMPNLYIAQKIQGNRFKIAGGIPGMEVSWQVTGIRHDPFAERNRIPVEEEKPASERGTYLYPEGYGQPKEKGLDYLCNPHLFEP